MSEPSREDTSPTEAELAIQEAEAIFHKNRPVLASDTPNAINAAEDILSQSKQEAEQIEQNKKAYKWFMDHLGEPIEDWSIPSEGIVVNSDRLDGFREGLVGEASPAVDSQKIGFKEQFNDPNFPDSEHILRLSTKREKPKHKGDIPTAYVVLEGITEQDDKDLDLYGKVWKGLRKKFITSYMLAPDGKTTVTERLVVTDQNTHHDEVLMSQIVQNPSVPENLWLNTRDHLIDRSKIKMPNIVQGVKSLLKIGK